MEKLTIKQEPWDDALYASPQGSTLQIECSEPWAGDTESGIGRSAAVQLTPGQAIQLAEYLIAWATGKTE